MAYSEYNLANLNSRIQQIKMLIKRDNSTMKVVFKNIFIRVHNNGASLVVSYIAINKHNVAGEYKLSFTESLKINPAIQHMQTMEHQIKEEPKRISCPQLLTMFRHTLRIS